VTVSKVTPVDPARGEAAGGRQVSHVECSANGHQHTLRNDVSCSLWVVGGASTTSTAGFLVGRGARLLFIEGGGNLRCRARCTACLGGGLLLRDLLVVQAVGQLHCRTLGFLALVLWALVGTATV
jgi:hypothetical protein